MRRVDLASTGGRRRHGVNRRRIGRVDCAGARSSVLSHDGFSPLIHPEAIAAIRDLGVSRGFDVESTEDPTWFTAASLARFRAVVFLSSSGDVLDAAQERAFESFIRAGGGFVGVHVHAATDTEYDWPFYQRLVGAAFSKHAAGTPLGRVRVVDGSHLSTSHLPETWERSDEWYLLRETPIVFPEVHVLLELDEDSAPLAPEFRMGGRHPVSWYQAYAGGRAFTTTLGHTEENFAEPLFRQHLSGALVWAATGARDPKRLAHDFDGVSEAGRWRAHGTPFAFDLDLTKSALSMFDKNGVNQHVTREGVTLPAGSPYSIDTLFTIPRVSRNGARDELNSSASISTCRARAEAGTTATPARESPDAETATSPALCATGLEVDDVDGIVRKHRSMCSCACAPVGAILYDWRRGLSYPDRRRPG